MARGRVLGVPAVGTGRVLVGTGVMGGVMGRLSAETGFLPEKLPEPWDWPARQRKDGYLYLRFGSTERPLHRLVFMLKEGLNPAVKYGKQTECVNMQCEYCGKAVMFGVNVNIDHMDGDKLNNHVNNLVCSCIGCNRRKGGADWTFR